MPWESITKFNYNLCLLYYVSSLVLSSWICDSLVSCHYVTLCVNVIIVRLESWVVWVYLRSPAILPVSYQHLIIKLYHYLHGEALLFLFSTYGVINNVLLAIEGKRFFMKNHFRYFEWDRVSRQVNFLSLILSIWVQIGIIYVSARIIQLKMEVKRTKNEIVSFDDV